MQRYVITRGQVFRWEEKAPFVESGVSVQGSVEYDPETSKVRCHECGEWHKSISHHVKSHGITSREYKIRHGLRARKGISSPVAAERFRIAAQTRANLCLPELRERIRKARAVAPRPTGAAMKNASIEGRNEHGTCNAQLLNKIQRIQDEMGIAIAKKLSAGNRKAIRNVFGSWGSACEVAGVTPGFRPGVRGKFKFSKEVLCELLRDFYVLNKRLPNRQDWNSGSLPSRGTIGRAFGGLPEAYRAAGLVRVLQEKTHTAA